MGKVIFLLLCLMLVEFKLVDAGIAEGSSSDAIQTQRKWDEIRSDYAKAMLELRLGEPEQKVIKKVEGLFAKGADVSTFNDEALETAILYHARRLTKLFLEHGADPDGFRFDSKPLKIAIKYADRETVDLLLHYKATPLPAVEVAQLRLTIAAARGDLKSIDRELSNGASINSTDKLDHTTPLIEATMWGRLEAVKLLLNRGAEPNHTGQVNGIDLFGQSRATNSLVGSCTPLHAATLHGGRPEIIRLLLKAGAPVSSTNCHKSLTPLHVAAKFRSLSATSVLLKEGAKVMARDADGKTPLDYAEHGPLIKLLKAHGARE